MSRGYLVCLFSLIPIVTFAQGPDTATTTAPALVADPALGQTPTAPGPLLATPFTSPNEKPAINPQPPTTNESILEPNSIPDEHPYALIGRRLEESSFFVTFEYTFTQATLSGKRPPPQGVAWDRPWYFQGNDGGTATYGPSYKATIGYHFSERYGSVAASAQGDITDQAFLGYWYWLLPIVFWDQNDPGPTRQDAQLPNQRLSTHTILDRYQFDLTYRTPFIGSGSYWFQPYIGVRRGIIFGNDQELEGPNRIRQRLGLTGDFIQLDNSIFRYQVTQSFRGSGYFLGLGGVVGQPEKEDNASSFQQRMPLGFAWRFEFGQLFGYTTENYREEDRNFRPTRINYLHTRTENIVVNTFGGELGVNFGSIQWGYRLDVWNNVLGSNRPNVNYLSHGLYFRIGRSF